MNVAFPENLYMFLLFARNIILNYSQIKITNICSVRIGVLYKAVLLHKKHFINSRALTGEKPCINKAIHTLLTHGYMATRLHNFQYDRTGAINLMPLRDAYCLAQERA